MRLCSFPRAARVFACAALLAASAAAPAAAEVPSPTAQARAAHAEFLAYADPPPEPGAVCLVDTGVDPNPDTTGVVLRTAIDGGSGWDEGKTKHGTKMAMVMGGAVNGWGTVGAWPALRIVSVRALPVGMESFPFEQYERGIRRCQDAGARAQRSRWSSSRSAGRERRAPRSARSSSTGSDAAGVEASTSSPRPGTTRGPSRRRPRRAACLGVGGADAIGALCSFSSRGDGLDLAAPGCGVEQADPLTGAPVLAGRHEPGVGVHGGGPRRAPLLPSRSRSGGGRGAALCEPRLGLVPGCRGGVPGGRSRRGRRAGPRTGAAASVLPAESDRSGAPHPASRQPSPAPPRRSGCRSLGFGRSAGTRAASRSASPTARARPPSS